MDLKNGEKAVTEIAIEFGKDRAMFVKTDVTKFKDMEGKQ